MVWNDMSDAEKRAYIAKAATKKSASAAAREVGATRGAILGAAHRYGVPFTKTVNASLRREFNAFVKTKGREQAYVEPASPGGAPKNAREAAAWRKLDALPAWAPLEGRKPQALERISMCQCHWPVWRDGEPYMVCGAATNEVEGYCDEHRKIAGGRRKTEQMPGDGGYKEARLKDANRENAPALATDAGQGATRGKSRALRAA